jgi:hypothetical protein
MVLGGGVGQNELHEEGNDPRPFDSPYNGYENRSVSYSKLFAQVDLAAIEDTHGRLTIAARFERSRFKESSNWQRQEDADTLTPGSTTHDGLASIATICAIGKGQLGNSNAWLVGSFGPCFSLSDPYTGFSSAWILGLGVQWYY